MLDASAVVPWFLQEPDSASARSLLGGNVSLHAPDFMAIEVANTLWKRNRRGELEGDDVVQAIATIAAMGIHWLPTAAAISSATRLALDLGHPVYDCLYLTLARSHGLPIATFDDRLRRAAGRLNIAVYSMKGKR